MNDFVEFEDHRGELHKIDRKSLLNYRIDTIHDLDMDHYKLRLFNTKNKNMIWRYFKTLEEANKVQRSMILTPLPNLDKITNDLTESLNTFLVISPK